MNWILLVQNRDKGRAIVNRVLGLRAVHTLPLHLWTRSGVLKKMGLWTVLAPKSLLDFFNIHAYLHAADDRALAVE